jgi:hypothetical protein
VIRAADVLELGNLGTRAISGLAGNRSFGLWTTTPGGRLGGRCHLIAGTRVCRRATGLPGESTGWCSGCSQPPRPTQPRPSGRACPRSALCGAWSRPRDTSPSRPHRTAAHDRLSPPGVKCLGVLSAARTAAAGRNGSPRNRLATRIETVDCEACIAPYPVGLRADNRGIELADRGK